MQVRLESLTCLGEAAADGLDVLVGAEDLLDDEDHREWAAAGRHRAVAGSLAIAPELFARQGDVSKIQDIQEIIATVVSKVPDAQVMADLDATAAWAQESGKGETARLGITGFCWGGRIVWLYAAHRKDLKPGPSRPWRAAAKSGSAIR